MVKIIKGGKLTEAAQEPALETPTSTQQNETYPQLIGRNITRGLERISEIPFQIIDVLGQQPGFLKRAITGEQVEPLAQQYRQSLAEKLPAGYLEPKNTGEEISDMVAIDLPLLALTGGFTTVPKAIESIGRSALSSVGIKGGQALGQAVGGLAGETGKKIGGALGGLAGGIGSGLTIDYAKQIGRKLPSTALNEWADQTRNQFYNQAAEAAPQIPVEATKIDETLKKVIKQIEQAGPAFPKEDTLATIQDIEQNIDPLTNTIPASVLWQKKKELNDLVYKQGVTDFEKNIYNQILPDLRNALDKTADSIPAFSGYKIGEELTKAINNRSFITETLEKLSPGKKIIQSPYTYMILTGAYNTGIPIAKKLGIGFPAALTFQEIMRNIDLLSKSPTIRNQLLKVGQSATLQNETQLLINIRKLDNAIEKKAHDLPKSAVKTNAKLISGSKAI